MKIVIFCSASRVGKWSTMEYIRRLYNIDEEKSTGEFYEGIKTHKGALEIIEKNDLMNHCVNNPLHDIYFNLLKARNDIVCVYLYRRNKEEQYKSMILAEKNYKLWREYYKNVEDIKPITISRDKLRLWKINQEKVEKMHNDMLMSFKNKISLSFEELYEYDNKKDGWKKLFNFLNKYFDPCQDTDEFIDKEIQFNDTKNRTEAMKNITYIP